MDSTAQWFYVPVLGGQKLDQVSGLNLSIFRLGKFDKVSVIGVSLYWENIFIWKYITPLFPH
jgi:hypothetical protein